MLSRVRTVRPKLGVFSKMFKIQLFCCFITQLVNKLQQWSLYEVIEDILPIVLNTKRPLSDIWLLRYKQNSFGCFQRNSEVKFLGGVSKKKFSIFQVLGTVYFAVCHRNP